MTSIAPTEVRSWTFPHHAELPPGPWTDEPDKLQWVDQATGLDCLIKRPNGSLCGYVGVTKDHPWFRVGYSEHIGEPCDEGYCYSHSPDARVEVHGGLTYASDCQETAGDDAICHVPFPGRDGDVWWFGFDCAHAGDFGPRDVKYGDDYGDDYGDVYRSVGYVQSECADLARQLAEVSA